METNEKSIIDSDEIFLVGTSSGAFVTTPATNRFMPIKLKPSVMKSQTLLKYQEFKHDPILKVSYIYCLGTTDPNITLLFLEGSESEYFILTNTTNSYNCLLVKFKDLFNEINEPYVGFRKIVASYDTFAVMEMINGDLYSFDCKNGKLKRFVIQNIRNVIHFSKGVMSNMLMVNTNLTEILMVEKE